MSMKAEDLNRANEVMSNITKHKSNARDLKIKIDILKAACYSSIDITIKKFDYHRDANPRVGQSGGIYEQDSYSMSIDRSLLIKSLNDKLYIEENLLRKYELELESL